MRPGVSFRQSEDLKYIGLAMPRFLSRLPYGAKTNLCEWHGFDEETCENGSHEHYTWANSAYAMAVNITRSVRSCMAAPPSVGGVGRRGAQPAHVCLLPPTTAAWMPVPYRDRVISDRREGELAKAGLMPLVHRKNTDFAAFIGAQSVHQPAEYDDPAATANANPVLAFRIFSQPVVSRTFEVHRVIRWVGSPVRQCSASCKTGF